jgi:hypothetical protein
VGDWERAGFANPEPPENLLLPAAGLAEHRSGWDDRDPAAVAAAKLGKPPQDRDVSNLFFSPSNWYDVSP